LEPITRNQGEPKTVNVHFILSAGDGAEWAKGTDWPLDQQRLNQQIEQYKKERARKHDSNAQRPNRNDLKAMIANLGSEDEHGDQTDGKLENVA